MFQKEKSEQPKILIIIDDKYLSSADLNITYSLLIYENLADYKYLQSGLV